tara:strand:+ start:1911 stop:2318 length:408 start_codon:yes stop_codon:yes gene_type:complete
MKIVHTLKEVAPLDLTVFGINSHVKGYSLCWHINKILDLDLIKNKGATTSEKETFSCFEFMLEEQKTLLVQNKSKKGFLLSEKKKIDYFLTFEPAINLDKRKEFLLKLSESSKILLIFEIDLEKEPEAHRFIFND